MADYTDEEWDSIGKAWRRAAGLDATAPFDAPAFIRWLKHAGHIKDYVCVPDGDLLLREGEFHPDGRIFYAQTTWEAAERRDPHASWTLIHEASHAILNHQEIRHRAQPAARNRFSSQTNRDEHQAHRLTASIMAPFDKIDFNSQTTVDDVRRTFNLSREAAARRFDEFQRMYRRKIGVPRPLPAGVIDFLVEQQRKGYRVTSLNNIEPIRPSASKRYEGDACPCCTQFMLVRDGLGMKCDNCGARTGDD